MDGVRLTEAGLLVRPWEPTDAGAVYRACQDPEIQRWTMVPRPYLREHAEGYVRAADDTVASFGVVDQATGEVLGACGLVSVDRASGTGEIGYWTAPWARGRGVATGAARAVSRWALHSVGLRRLQWQAEVGNFASRVVAAEVGFQFEGVRRQALRRGDGTFADGWVAGLLPGELRVAGAASSTDLVRTRARARVFGRPQPTLTGHTDAGETVRLRPMRPADIPRIVAACRDPLSARYTTVPHPYTEADANAFLYGYAPTVWARGLEAVFALADGDDQFAGSMSLRLPGEPMTTPIGDVGYLVGPWARGRGYAPAALRALCEWGFAELAVHRMEWKAFVGNDASRTVAERAGFTVEGAARDALWQRDTYRDAWTGARLATDPYPSRGQDPA
jgi:RimJ/RimL family protein N-acetyltransferase